MGAGPGVSIVGTFNNQEKALVGAREILMGVGDGVASVIMLTFTSEPCPHADFYK